MCSFPESTQLAKSKEGPRSVLPNHKNFLTIVYNLETRNTTLYIIYERDHAPVLINLCTLFLAIHQLAPKF